MRSRINGLTIIRVVAVLMIVMVHFCQSWNLPYLLSNFVHFGMYGVQLFFLLSGYLIFASLSRNGSLASFYRRRSVRILPVYYVVVFVNFFVFAVAFKAVPKDTTGLGWLRYIFFLNTLIPANSVDYWNNLSALWSIPAFILFYAMAPLLFKVSKSVKTAFGKMVALIGLNIASLYIPEISGGGGCTE
ncbi:MAG: acyltransferase family protein [Clostridiales bacterium]|nr:acyltransferase family protein [Clostridiales bacterium]